MIRESGIYMIENSITGKRYIGQSVHIRRRLSIHKSGNSSGCSYLYSAMKRYGADNFIFSILEVADPTCLNELESGWIKKLDTLYPHGYNLTTGGDSNFHITNYTREKMSESAKNRPPMSGATKTKLISLLKGRTHKPSTKELMSKAQRGKPESAETKLKREYRDRVKWGSKRIGCSNGKEYPYVIEASADTGIPKNIISNIYNGWRKGYNGVTFWKIL